MLWYGDPDDLPDNYQICDGTNGTPDLRDKFIVGASSFATVPKSSIDGAPAATGGTTSHTHSSQPGAAIFYTANPDKKFTTESHVPPYVALYYVMRLA